MSNDAPSKKTSLAFRIPAEPGWRAVAISTGDAVDEHHRRISLGVVPVASWGFEAGTMTQGEPSGLTGVVYQGLALGGGYSGLSFFPEPGVKLAPYNAEGERIDALSIVPPAAEDTDKALMVEAKAWVEKFNTKATEWREKLKK